MKMKRENPKTLKPICRYRTLASNLAKDDTFLYENENEKLLVHLLTFWVRGIMEKEMVAG